MGLARGEDLVDGVGAEVLAEVNLADCFVVDEVAWGAVCEDFAIVENVGAVADFEGAFDGVVGDENGDVFFAAEAVDFDLEFFDGDGVDAREGFVEKDE